MTYVITRSCCNDASCVEVCPVDCIHPTPDEPGFASAEMLYIEPEACIDCGSCVDACPAAAVYADHDVPEHLRDYLAVNAAYYEWTGEPPAPSIPAAPGPRADPAAGPLRVAVVGSGPAGWYVADELDRTKRAEVEVVVLDRLTLPHGLVRYGVAPDHLDTRKVTDSFDRIAAHRRTSVRLGVEVGRDLTHEELLEHVHAVVYATGAATGRVLGIPGETLPGSVSSADIVGWYNGHPDHAGLEPALEGERAVIIGNGNVALDIARLLLSSPASLAESAMAPRAREALAASRIREVVVLARRGPADAAFSSPELRALLDHPDFDVVVSDPGVLPHVEDRTPAGFALKERLDLLRRAAEAGEPGNPSGRRLVLRFGLTPEAVVGETAATGLRVVPTGGGEAETIEAGLVIRATGYRSVAVPGVPFDEEAGRFVHEGGRVLDPTDGNIVRGTYATGWAKRGPRGVIGTNRGCAEETARALLDDFVAGRLPTPALPGGLDDRLAARGVPVVDPAATAP